MNVRCAVDTRWAPRADRRRSRRLRCSLDRRCCYWPPLTQTNAVAALPTRPTHRATTTSMGERGANNKHTVISSGFTCLESGGATYNDCGSRQCTSAVATALVGRGLACDGGCDTVNVNCKQKNNVKSTNITRITVIIETYCLIV